MKLIMVACIKEHKDIVTSLFDVSRISILSISEATGHKNIQPVNLHDNWFGKAGEEFSSLLFFSFTGEDQAIQLLSHINAYNDKAKGDFPIHAFMLGVEAHSV